MKGIVCDSLSSLHPTHWSKLSQYTREFPVKLSMYWYQMRDVLIGVPKFDGCADDTSIVYVRQCAAHVHCLWMYLKCSIFHDISFARSECDKMLDGKAATYHRRIYDFIITYHLFAEVPHDCIGTATHRFRFGRHCRRLMARCEFINGNGAPRVCLY